MTFSSLLPYAIPFGSVVVAGILWLGRLEWHRTDHEKRIAELEKSHGDLKTSVTKIETDVSWIRKHIERSQR